MYCEVAYESCASRADQTMTNTQLQIAVDPALIRALEQAARENASSLPSFIQRVLSEHLILKGYLRTTGQHGIPISQLNSENDG